MWGDNSQETFVQNGMAVGQIGHGGDANSPARITGRPRKEGDQRWRSMALPLPLTLPLATATATATTTTKNNTTNNPRSRMCDPRNAPSGATLDNEIAEVRQDPIDGVYRHNVPEEMGP